MEKALSGAPLKPLLWLGALVLAAHLLLLQASASLRLGSDPAPLHRPLVTRLMALAAATRPAAPAVARAQPPKPRPATAPAALADPVEPTVTPAPPTTAAPVLANPPAADDTAAVSPDASASAPTAAAAPAPAADPGPLPSYAVPGSVRLKYDISGTVRSLNYSARGELLWRHDGASYEARLEIGAFLLGSRVQSSRGQLTAEGLAPKRFSDKVRSEVAAHFERDQGQIIFSSNTPAAALQPGAQDQLSIFVQLASLLAGEPARYPAGTAIELQVVGAREAGNWRLVVDGPEQLQLPGGEQATLKLTRPPRQPYDLKVELWLAPALGMLPARIRLTQDNGDFIDQQWRASEAP